LDPAGPTAATATADDPAKSRPDMTTDMRVAIFTELPLCENQRRNWTRMITPATPDNGQIIEASQCFA
jgi:hypothetical protein